LIPNN